MKKRIILINAAFFSWPEATKIRKLRKNRLTQKFRNGDIIPCLILTLAHWWVWVIHQNQGMKAYLLCGTNMAHWWVLVLSQNESLKTYVLSGTNINTLVVLVIHQNESLKTYVLSGTNINTLVVLVIHQNESLKTYVLSGTNINTPVILVIHQSYGMTAYVPSCTDIDTVVSERGHESLHPLFYEHRELAINFPRQGHCQCLLNISVVIQDPRWCWYRTTQCGGVSVVCMQAGYHVWIVLWEQWSEWNDNMTHLCHLLLLGSKMLCHSVLCCGAVYCAACILMTCVSPWCDLHTWSGVKYQVTKCVSVGVSWFLGSLVLCSQVLPLLAIMWPSHLIGHEISGN